MLSLIFVVVIFVLVFRLIRWAWRSVIRGVDSATELYDRRNYRPYHTSTNARWNYTKRQFAGWRDVIIAIIVLLVVFAIFFG